MIEKTLKEKTAKGLFWGGLSNGMQQFLSLLIGLVLLKKLTPDDYGMIYMLAIFTGIASIIQESGFTVALTNKPIFQDKDYNAVFWFNLIAGVIIYILLYLCAPLIADFYGYPELILLARVSFLSIVIGSFGIAHNAVLFKLLLVKERAKIDILSVSVSGIVGIYLALNGYGYWALALQTLVNTLMVGICRWYFSPWKPNLDIDFRPIKEMLGFSSKMLLSSIVYQVHANIFSLLLGKFYRPSDVGYFSQGTKWANMGSLVINGMINNVAQPTFVQLAQEPTRLAQVFRKMIRFVAFVSFPIMFGLAFIGNEFIGFINEDWLPCVPILQLYCLWGAFAPIHLLYTQIVVTYGKSGCYLFTNLCFAFCQIGLAVAVLSFGIYWMAFANTVVAFIYILIWHRIVANYIPIKLMQIVKDIIPYFFITIIIFTVIGVTIKLTDIDNLLQILILKVVLSTVLYVFLMNVFNSIVFKEALTFMRKQ